MTQSILQTIKQGIKNNSLERYGAANRDAFRNYFNISGRSTRNQFFNYAIAATIFEILMILSGTTGIFILYLILAIGLVTCGIRRMNDAGRSRWWILAYGFIPVIGTIIFYYVALSPSKPEGDSNEV